MSDLTKDTLRAEMNKCDVICENCHAGIHCGDGKYLALYKREFGL